MLAKTLFVLLVTLFVARLCVYFYENSPRVRVKKLKLTLQRWQDILDSPQGDRRKAEAKNAILSIRTGSNLAVHVAESVKALEVYARDGLSVKDLGIEQDEFDVLSKNAHAYIARLRLKELRSSVVQPMKELVVFDESHLRAFEEAAWRIDDVLALARGGGFELSTIESSPDEIAQIRHLANLGMARCVLQDVQVQRNMLPLRNCYPDMKRDQLNAILAKEPRTDWKLELGPDLLRFDELIRELWKREVGDALEDILANEFCSPIRFCIFDRAFEKTDLTFEDFGITADRFESLRRRSFLHFAKRRMENLRQACLEIQSYRRKRFFKLILGMEGCSFEIEKMMKRDAGYTLIDIQNYLKLAEATPTDIASSTKECEKFARIIRN